MNEQPIIDVKKVIEDSTQVKTIQELEKEGRRAVKVVRASRISELISQAVDNVIRDRSMQVLEAERSQLISATGEEFKRLLQSADDERKKGEEQRQKVLHYEKEMLQIKHKLELSEHVHTEDIRLLQEQKAVVDELREKVVMLKHELEELVRRQQGEQEERDGMRAELTALRKENLGLRSALCDAEARARQMTAQQPSAGGESIKDLVGEVKAIRDSFERGWKDRASGEESGGRSENEMMTKLEGVIHSSMDQIVKQLAVQFQHLPGTAGAPPVEAAKIVLDNLFTEVPGIESNLANISVQSSEGTGISDSLQRLKKLHAKGIGGSGGDSGATGDDSAASKGER